MNEADWNAALRSLGEQSQNQHLQQQTTDNLMASVANNHQSVGTINPAAQLAPAARDSSGTAPTGGGTSSIPGGQQNSAFAGLDSQQAGGLLHSLLQAWSASVNQLPPPVYQPAPSPTLASPHSFLAMGSAPWSESPLAVVLAHPQGCAMLLMLFQLWMQLQQQSSGSPNPATQPPQTYPFSMPQSSVFPGFPIPNTVTAQAQAPTPPSNAVDWNGVMASFMQGMNSAAQSQYQQWPSQIQPQQINPSYASVSIPAMVATGTMRGTANSSTFTTREANWDGAKDATNAETSPKRKKRKYTHESFPQKLHRLILDAAANDKQHVICFNESGNRFEICSARQLEELLPTYFRTGKMSSFKRLMHMYAFKRVQGTWNEGIFEHPNFHRDKPELLDGVVRVERGYGAKY